MQVILSIKPMYVDNILSGLKKFEFRKVAFKKHNVTSVIIYSTKPVGKVVGEFDIKKTHIDSPEAIWKKTRHHAGINKKLFNAYYADSSLAVALEIGEVRPYKTPIDLSDIRRGLTPPQSFCYISDGQKNQPEFQF